MIHDDDLLVIETYAKREYDPKTSRMDLVFNHRGKDLLTLIKELREQQDKTKRAEETYAKLVASVLSDINWFDVE